MDLENERYFMKRKSEIIGKRIAVYGTGIAAEGFIKDNPELQVVGLMDQKMTGVIKWGRPVIDVKDLSTYKVESVIIAARKCFVDEIYHRIASYCKIHQIAVYDTKLRPVIREQVAHDGRGLTKSQIVKAITNWRTASAGAALAQSMLLEKLKMIHDYVSSESGRCLLEPEDWGYLALGPLMTGFLLFLNQLTEKKHYDFIWFGARDGYLPERLYRIISKGGGQPFPCCPVYLHTSRMSCLAAGLFSKKDIEYAIRLPFSGTAEEMLTKRFQLSKRQIRKRETGVKDEEYLLQHEKFILAQSQIYRSHYLEYLKPFAYGGSVLFVDFYSAGTCQYYLEKICGQRLEGAYFYRMPVADWERQQLTVYSMYGKESEGQNKTFLDNVYITLEGWITSDEPTVLSFGEGGRPVFSEEKRTAGKLQAMKEIHKGVEQFFVEYLSRGGTEMLETAFADEILKLFYTALVQKQSLSSVMTDEFTNRG